MFLILWLTYFVLLPVHLSSTSTVETLSCNNIWLLLWMLQQVIWAFHFQAFGLPLSFNRFWSVSVCMFHIILQKLQVAVLMLHRMVFHLFGEMVALHWDNSAAKAHSCNQDGSVSFSCQTSLPLGESHQQAWQGKCRFIILF